MKLGPSDDRWAIQRWILQSSEAGRYSNSRTMPPESVTRLASSGS